MRYTTAGRAAFIVQLTTVIVPLLDALVSRRLPNRWVLAGCALAFSGVSVLLTDGASPSDLAALDLSAGPSGLLSALLSTGTGLGDGLVGLSALAYSLHVVRLSYHAPRLPPVELARAKEISRLVYASVVLAVGVAISPAQADALGAFMRSFVDARLQLLGDWHRRLERSGDHRLPHLGSVVWAGRCERWHRRSCTRRSRCGQPLRLPRAGRDVQ